MIGQTIIGQTISRNRIIEKLGCGGMGEVYLGVDETLGRKVASKFLPAEVARDQRAKQRLLREAQTAAALDHPNICAIYEVGQEDGYTFICRPSVHRRETLAASLKRPPPDCARTRQHSSRH
jgi:serine/threonine protein kinase